MNIVPLALISILLTPFVTPGTSAADPSSEAEVALTFVAPNWTGWEELSFPESSFSVPHPIVVLDPVVFGDPDENPGKTVVEQIGPDRMRIRVSGRVYDLLADIVADRRADIGEVEVISGMLGPMATVPVIPIEPEEQRETAPHPLAGQLGQSSRLERSIRPFPFAGRFVSETVELPVGTGSNDIYVKATGVNGEDGVSFVEVRATVNREEMRYDLEAEIGNQLEHSMHNPVLVYVHDPRIDETNVGEARATVNGVEVGMRFVDGQLQLDRPIIGVNRTPPPDIPNLVNVTGDPNSFRIEYVGVQVDFGWSYTAGN